MAKLFIFAQNDSEWIKIYYIFCNFEQKELMIFWKSESGESVKFIEKPDLRCVFHWWLYIYPYCYLDCLYHIHIFGLYNQYWKESTINRLIIHNWKYLLKPSTFLTSPRWNFWRFIKKFHALRYSNWSFWTVRPYLLTFSCIF